MYGKFGERMLALCVYRTNIEKDARKEHDFGENVGRLQQSTVDCVQRCFTKPCSKVTALLARRGARGRIHKHRRARAWWAMAENHQGAGAHDRQCSVLHAWPGQPRHFLRQDRQDTAPVRA